MTITLLQDLRITDTIFYISSPDFLNRQLSFNSEGKTFSIKLTAIVSMQRNPDSGLIEVGYTFIDISGERFEMKAQNEFAKIERPRQHLPNLDAIPVPGDSRNPTLHVLKVCRDYNENENTILLSLPYLSNMLVIHNKTLILRLGKMLTQIKNKYLYECIPRLDIVRFKKGDIVSATEGAVNNSEIAINTLFQRILRLAPHFSKEVLLDFDFTFAQFAKAYRKELVLEFQKLSPIHSHFLFKDLTESPTFTENEAMYADWNRALSKVSLETLQAAASRIPMILTKVYNGSAIRPTDLDLNKIPADDGPE